MFVVVTLLSFAALLKNVQAAGGGSSFFFFTNQSNSFFSTVSAGCNTALTAPIPQCPIEITALMAANGYYTDGNATVMDALCASACPQAFASYRTNVTKACANDTQPQSGFPATYWVDAASSAFTQACLKDSKSGKYCTDFFNSTFGDAQNPSAVLGGYNATALCSECVVNLFKYQQSTPYSNYGLGSAAAWAAIQSQCKLSFPTATPTLLTNVTSLGNYAPSGYPTAACVGGRSYTVVSGDNCGSIAQKQQVSYGSITTLNSLYPDCSNLILGASICLPPACTSYVVQSGDTCAAIANRTNTQFQQLISWNPTIDSYCLNLIAGQNICVGPPGGFQNFSTIAGATVTQTAIYASTTASRPSPVASGTTTKCGVYYKVQSGDYCQLVAVNKTISLSLFEAINPSIDQACDNLQTGVFYCVKPTQDWNTTTTSTVVTAPTTTPSGTTANCYQYYVIQSGDYCAKVQDQFGISFAQFQSWNPSLLNDCSNLVLGDAYCVNGAPLTSVTSTAPATAIASKSTSTSTKQGANSGTKPATKLRREAENAFTAAVARIPMTTAGGVPFGWPGVGNKRAMKQFGVLAHADL